jgi:hypothetical protein
MTWTAAEVAEEALRTIGVLSPYDEEPDPADFAIALRRLDSVVAFLASTEEIMISRVIEQELVLEPARKSYPLSSLLPVELQYIESIYFTKDGSNRMPVELIRLKSYEELQSDNPSLDIPENAYVERRDGGLLYPYGVPSVAGYKFIIRGRKYTGDLEQNGGSTATGFAEAWNLCLVDLLAHNIGSGPITKLPRGELNDLLKEGERKKRLLMAYNNRENVQEPRFTQFNTF